MHWLKRLNRGYNQSEVLANTLSKATGIEKVDALKASRGHSTQTRKNRYERWENTKGLYQVKNAEAIEGKHLLIVDDVITTGATILACCEEIHRVSPTTRLSVLSLGVTHLQ